MRQEQLSGFGNTIPSVVRNIGQSFENSFKLLFQNDECALIVNCGQEENNLAFILGLTKIWFELACPADGQMHSPCALWTSQVLCAVGFCS